MKECKACKRQIADYSMFCPYCGNKTGEQPSAELLHAEAEDNSSAKRPAEVFEVPSAPAAPVQQPVPAKSDRKKLLMAIVAVAVVLIVIVCIARPGDPAPMSEKQTARQTREEDRWQEMIDVAMVYARNGDYVSALAKLDEYIDEHGPVEQLQTARQNCMTEFQNYVAEESLRRARSGDYHSALALAEEGLNYFTSARVTELVLIYRSRIPLQLSEMEIFLNETRGGSWATYTDVANKYLADNYGNQYTSSLTVSCGSVTYLLKGQYSTFSGTVACPKLNVNDGMDSATLYVYGDGRLLKTFSEFNPASRPEEFSISVAGVERLQLSWECAGYNIWNNWGDYATIFGGELLPVPMELPAN